MTSTHIFSFPIRTSRRIRLNASETDLPLGALNSVSIVMVRESVNNLNDVASFCHLFPFPFYLI